MYPTEEQLVAIRDYDLTQQSAQGLVDLVLSCWWHPNEKNELDGQEWFLATGGWSGNEDIISALQENRFMFWATCWQKSIRGDGHWFTFLPWMIK